MSQNINIRLSSNVVQLSPGEGTVLAVTVINNGRGVERLELSINNIDPGWLLLDQNELLLYPDAPGNEGTVNLQISLPTTALPGSYSPTIDIRNAGEAVVTATAPLVLIVNQLAAAPGPEFALVQESVQTKHKWARFQLQVGNPLDLPQTLKLYGRPNLPSTRLRIIPPVIEVPPRGQAVSVIELEPAKRNRIRPGKRYDFMVAAENAPGQVNGYMVQTASLPFLAKILATPFLLIMSILLPLLIIGAVVAFILWPRTAAPTNQTQQVARCVTTNLAQTASLRMGQLNTDIWVTDADTGVTRKVQQEPVERLPGMYSSLLSVSPDGKQLAYVTAANEALDDAVIYTVNLNSSSKVRVAGIPAGFWPTHPIWSNDMSQLGYVVRNGSQLDFNVVNLSDKKSTTIPIPQMSPDQFYGDPGVTGPLCFSTDNTRVVLASKQSTTQLEVSLSDRSSKVVNRPAAVAASQDKSFAPSAAGTVEPPLAPLGDSACQVKTFSQNDPLWRDLVMKGRSDNQNDKIGAAGCALTSAAMLLNYYKVNTDPNELNACMGTDSNPINWNLPATQCSDGFVAGAQRDYFSWDGLNDSLNQGQPAIVGLLGGQTGVHFLVVLGGSDSIASTYRVNDPWDGTNNKSLAYYIAKGYQLQWLVSFKGANPPTCKPRVTAVADADPTFKLKQTSPEDGHAYTQPVSIIFSGGSDRTTAKLTTFINSSAAAPTVAAGQGSVTPGVTTPAEQTQNQPTQNSTSQDVANGQQLNGEGAYQLVIDSPGDNSVNQRLTTNFIIDMTPPTLTRIPIGAFESNLSATGAQIAHGNVTLQLKATDNLSGVSTIDYMVNGGAPQPYLNDVNPKPVIFTQAGDYDITFKATDGAGNVSAIQEWKFVINLATADLGANGQGGANPTPAATTPPPVVTTPPADANGGAGSGGAGGGGAGAATTAAPTTAAPTTVALPPAVLVAAPAQLAFDATMENTIVPINITNSGGQAANIVIQPPTGPAAAFLKFTATTGTVPAAGALPVQVQLASLNYTAQPIQGTFNIVYNGTVLPITFAVAPQPAPTIAFTSPASGPISKTVAVKMTVTTTGVAKPNHINLSAKYLDKVGGTVEERLLPGQANLSNSWSYNWDINALPPQEGIEIKPTLCWSVDETNCFKVDPGVTGLTIPKPSAAITLDPNIATLSGIVNIGAVVSGGPLDHITYSYAYKQNNADVGPITITEKATASNQYKVAWDTSSIPPQPAANSIKLNALVCWTGADSADTCAAPTSITPAALTVEAPTIVATALAEADAKSLPLQVSLSGTISKLTNPGATVWVDYKVIKTFGQAAVAVSAPATLSAPTNGTALWSANIDTSSLPPQTINFVPKICWDGNPSGSYCYPVAVPLAGIIPDIVPAFVDPKPADLSKPVSFVVAATPAGRASTVKILMSYTRFSGQVVDYTELTTQANQANSFTVPFDSTALGLAPNQTVNFKLVACNDSGYCSKPADAPIPFTIPASTLALAPTADSLQAAPLPPQVILTGVLTGRNVGSLQLSSIYNDLRHSATGTYTNTTVYAGIAADQAATTAPFPITWDTTDIPPQTGIALQYKLCWSGTLDSGCAAPVPAYSRLTKDAPAISKVTLNGSLEYNPTGNNILPIPYSSLVTNTIINLPITAVVSDTKVSSIKWQLRGVPSTGNDGFSLDLANVTVSNLQAVSTLQLNVAQLITNTNSADTPSDFQLVAMPVWQGVYTISDTNKIKVEPIKLITFQVNLKGADTPNPIAPVSTATAQTDAYKINATMIGSSTEISLTNFSTTNIVKRAYYNLSYNLGSTAPPNTSAQTGITLTTSTSVPITGTAASSFLVSWNHLTNLPKILPQAGIILGWRLCNTDAGDDSGCLPLNMTNSFNQVAGLTLAGIKYDPDPLVSNTNINKNIIDFNSHYFNSTFDAYAKVIGGPAIKTVRYIAYPTSATPDMDKAVILSTRDVTSSSDGSWHSSLYFASPDPPVGVTNPPPTQGAKLMLALGSNHLNMTLAVQMCITSEPNQVDDPSCSDWTGATQQALDSTSTARISGKLAILVVWKPMCTYDPSAFGAPTDTTLCGNPSFSTADPYNQYIQDKSNTTVPTRTLTLKVYKVPNGASTTVYSDTNAGLSINTAYIISGTATTNNITGTDAISTGTITTSSTINTYFLRRGWNIRSVTLPDDSANNTRSVKLQAVVSFNINVNPNTPGASEAGFIDGGSFTAIATVPTKGRDGSATGYCQPTCAPVINSVTTPPSTTVPSTTAPPTTAPSTTSPPTTAPSTTSPPTTAPSTTSPPTTAPGITAPSTTSPPTTAPPTTAPPTTAPPTTTGAGASNSPNPV